jgi:hypothetical protein
MSINRITNAAAARRTDIREKKMMPIKLNEIAMAAMIPPRVWLTSTLAEQDRPPSASPIDTALNLLIGYIPTEVLTLYVAVLAAIKQTNQVPNQVTQAMWTTFWVFLILTPIVVWLVYAGKLIEAKTENNPLPISGFGACPIWEMIAATIAYCAWAFALPNTPFTEYSSWYSAPLSGVVVLATSIVLGLLAPFFQKPLNVKKHHR